MYNWRITSGVCLLYLRILGPVRKSTAMGFWLQYYWSRVRGCGLSVLWRQAILQIFPFSSYVTPLGSEPTQIFCSQATYFPVHLTLDIEWSFATFVTNIRLPILYKEANSSKRGKEAVLYEYRPISRILRI